MEGRYEIKSKATGKVVYGAESDDIANDWNVKKRMILLNMDSDKKLRSHLEKYGMKDFEFSVVTKSVKAKPKEKTIAEFRAENDKKADENAKEGLKELTEVIIEEIIKPEVVKPKKVTKRKKK